MYLILSMYLERIYIDTHTHTYIYVNSLHWPMFIAWGSSDPDEFLDLISALPLTQRASASPVTFLLLEQASFGSDSGLSQLLFLPPGRISLQTFAYPYIICCYYYYYLPLSFLLTLLLGILTHLLFLEHVKHTLAPRPCFFQLELSSPRFLHGSHPHLFQVILCLCVYIFSKGSLKPL